MSETGHIVVEARVFGDVVGRRPLGVEHELGEHPLLTLDALAELADELPLAAVERHRADLPLLSPGGAPDLDGRPSDTVRTIESNGCWMVLWHIEQSERYERLLDECLDPLAAFLPPSHGDMRQREAFVFISAPAALTPLHFDPEHNFLLQIKGLKTMHVCEFPDDEWRERELTRYYAGGHRNLEARTPELEAFELVRGRGVYVPPFAPHWVQNGPEASVSLSITFRTRASQRDEYVRVFNGRLRRLGLHPVSPGRRALRDRVKAETVRLWREAGRVRARGAHADDAAAIRS